jgi:peroxiredoxin
MPKVQKTASLHEKTVQLLSDTDLKRLKSFKMVNKKKTLNLVKPGRITAIPDPLAQKIALRIARELFGYKDAPKYLDVIDRDTIIVRNQPLI